MDGGDVLLCCVLFLPLSFLDCDLTPSPPNFIHPLLYISYSFAVRVFFLSLLNL